MLCGKRSESLLKNHSYFVKRVVSGIYYVPKWAAGFGIESHKAWQNYVSSRLKPFVWTE